MFNAIPAINPGSHCEWEKPKKRTVKMNEKTVNLPIGTRCHFDFWRNLLRKYLVKYSSIIGASIIRIITLNEVWIIPKGTSALPPPSSGYLPSKPIHRIKMKMPMKTASQLILNFSG